MSEIPTRAEMLRFVADEIEAGLPEPMYVQLLRVPSTGSSICTLRLEDNDGGGVLAWAARVGAPEVRIGEPMADPNRAWRTNKIGGIGEGLNWHGWTFDLWSAVDEPIEDVEDDVECAGCDCATEMPRDPDDPGAYPGPDPDCDCVRHETGEPL